MKFSVIVPVYNVSKYLSKCVKSIAGQEGTTFEIVLVDDGSSDGSSVICDQFAKKFKNIVVIHKENGGLSDARNTGIKVATGEYILFVDGDDFIGQGALKAISDVIDAGSRPDVVCLELVKIWEEDGKKLPMGDGIDKRINNLTGDELYEYLANLPKYPASACTKAIRRQLLEDNDLYFIKGMLSEDLEWCIRLFLVAKIFRYCPHEYYFYRQARSGSICDTPSEKKVLDILCTFQKWSNYSRSMVNEAKRKMVCSYIEYVFRFLLLGYPNISPQTRGEFRKKVSTGDWILGNRKDKASICIRLSYEMLGIRATAVLLKQYLKMREK